jgi:hypothetical protein
MAELAAGPVQHLQLLRPCDSVSARLSVLTHSEQSTASVEKLVGKQARAGAKARVLVLRAGLPEI